jgi:tetratricopeptide (TPR) repeat protein
VESQIPEPASTLSRLTSATLLAVALCWGSPLPGFAHGSFHERIERANRDVEAEPDAPGPYLRRAEIYRHHGNFAAALADLDRAAALDPGGHEVDYFRGHVYLDSGHPEDAAAALGGFLEHEPRNPAALEGRARALASLGRHLEAASAYSRAIANRPVAIPATYLARAEALASAGDEHLPEALRGLDAGLATLGPVMTLQRAAIDLEIRRGDLDAALARLEGAAAAAPRQETWLARRGEILERAGRLDEARETFELARRELERLPPHRRQTGSMTRLDAQLRESLARIAGNP